MILERISDKLMLIAGEPAFWCPACREAHRFNVNQPNIVTGKRWNWDGNKEAPTFSPDLTLKIGAKVCHFYVMEGRIEYMRDSTHSLAGQHMPMVHFPDFKEG